MKPNQASSSERTEDTETENCKQDGDIWLGEIFFYAENVQMYTYIFFSNCYKCEVYHNSVSGPILLTSESF